MPQARLPLESDAPSPVHFLGVLHGAGRKAMHQSGDRLSHYRLLERIGVGRRGDVWKAVDTRSNREVAIRILPRIEQADRRARLDASIAKVAALDHPHIEQIDPVAESEGTRFISMELVTGTTLSRLIPTGGLSYGKLLDHALRLTDAVAAAHRDGVTHRDLTPSRVVFDDQGRMRVLGFGLGEVHERKPVAEVDPEEVPTLTSDHEVADRATLPYMSPEWVKGTPLDARSDVFSLGVMLFEMATGQRPFGGESPADLFVAVIHDAAPPATELNPTLPAALAQVIARCLEKDPARRYSSAVELHEELAKLERRA